MKEKQEKCKKWKIENVKSLKILKVFGFTRKILDDFEGVSGIVSFSRRNFPFFGKTSFSEEN